jgi:hypothetical protein
MSWTPSSFSSAETWRLTTDFDNPSCAAALVKLPAFTTAAKPDINGSKLALVFIFQQQCVDIGQDTKILRNEDNCG